MRGIKQFFMGFMKGMSNFGHNIALIINTILLAIVYLFAVGLTSIFAKIFKKHFLETKLSKSWKSEISRTPKTKGFRVNSYWSDLNLKNKPIEKYYRQF